MPLNTLRLNHQASTHPNDRIVFIKPLPRPPAQKPDYDRAELVLKAIAAQCLPIMKEHYLSVTTLEEYEPNPEFIGRNFNNGEIIQLVIKSKNGAWLPLNMIQMVMMHELAHNTHMNHGKGFWVARNLYAGQMRQLWGVGYTGEGLWGRGVALGNLESDAGYRVVPSEELADLPLCGGTFRSRRKKRKPTGTDLTWKEKRDKRIEKKFGKNGNALGEDEDKRLTLEIKSKGQLGSKPRVAQSKRGRELRAAAALARFGTNKKEVEEVAAAPTKEEDDDETADEREEYEELDAGQEDAMDTNGHKIVDGKGQGMIRVCGEENSDDVDVKNEMDELANLGTIPASHHEPNALGADEDGLIKKEHTGTPQQQARTTVAAPSTIDVNDGGDATDSSTATISPSPIADVQPSNSTNTQEVDCPICSMTNDTMRSTCIACAHVLDSRKDPSHWRCTSASCKGSSYLNAGDCGICGICGARKPKGHNTEQQVQPVGGSRSRPARGTAAGQSSHIAYI